MDRKTKTIYPSIDWLSLGLSTHQPLWVILCPLPEKGRKETEEIVEDMKERDREARGTGMKVKKQKQLKHSPSTLACYKDSRPCPTVSQSQLDGGAKVLCISHHRGLQLISAYSWARPAILVAGKGRGGMFLFLLFLHFHSCSSFFPVPLFRLFYCLFYLFSPFLWEMTQNDPQGLTCR